ILHNVFRTERLVRKAHVHNARGMAFRSREIDQTAFPKQAHAMSVFSQRKFFDPGTYNATLSSHLLQTRNIEFDIEVAAVADNGAVLHHGEVFTADDLQVACDGHEEVTDRGSLFHRHHAEAIHDRFEALQGIDLRHNHVSSHPFCPHG